MGGGETLRGLGRIVLIPLPMSESEEQKSEFRVYQDLGFTAPIYHRSGRTT